MARLGLSVVENDTRLLVRQIVGHHSTNDNVDDDERSVEKALIIFYRRPFLDTNRHSVSRSIEGLCCKLFIHSLEEKSNALKLLCDRFVHSHVFIGGDGDLQYSLLSMLVHLADRPSATEVILIHTDVYNCELDKREQDIDEDISRKSLLAELCHDELKPPISDDLSDWSDPENSTNYFDNPQPLIAKQPNASECHLVSPLHQKPLENVCENGNQDSRAWLTHNLAPQYWNDHPSTSVNQIHSRRSVVSKAVILRSQWEAYVERNSFIKTINESVELTEREIIRESLWLLQGRDQLFVFVNYNGSWIVRDGIAVSHLTQRCLHRMLEPFTCSGNILCKLRHFIEQQTTKSWHGQNDQNCTPICRTYEAYASALSSLLLKFERVVCELERTCVQQTTSITLLMLFDHVSTWFAKLRTLKKIHDAGIVSCPLNALVFEKAVHLQSELYSALIYSASEGGDSQVSRHTVAILLTLFRKTIRPYLEMIDSWVTFGNLEDDHAEFILARSAVMSSSVEGEKFWENAIVVRSRGPPFLRSTVDDLIITGKSTQLLRHLNRLGMRCSKVKIPETTEPKHLPSLHQLVEERLQRTIFRQLNLSKYQVSSKDVQLLSNMSEPSVPLWKRILAQNFKTVPTCSSIDDEDAETDFSVPPFGRHLGDLICECLDSVIRSRCCLNCSKLIEVLNDEFEMRNHLLFIRKFYLFEAGHIMFDFYSQLFDKIPANDIWNEEVHLKMILEDVLTSHTVTDSTRLSVELDRESIADGSTDLAHQYDVIRLIYKVPWPLDLVLSSSMLHKYDRIFSLLLRVKFTKYSMDELRFDDLYGRLDLISVKGQLMRMYIIRMKILQFVNSFHEFLMTRLLYDDDDRQSTKSKNNGSFRSLQDVIDEQKEILERIEKRCFLAHQRTVIILDTITEVFNSALAFHAYWKKETNINKGNNILIKIEKDLNNCGPFLLTVIRKSQSSACLLPHLESLVSTLCI